MSIHGWYILFPYIDLRLVAYCFLFLMVTFLVVGRQNTLNDMRFKVCLQLAKEALV